MPEPSARKPRLVILDSHGILFRAFFAMAAVEEPLMTSKGELTFAAHGYTETLIRVLDQLRPTHIFAAWDQYPSCRNGQMGIDGVGTVRDSRSCGYPVRARGTISRSKRSPERRRARRRS
jgi:hypothetical protein